LYGERTGPERLRAVVFMMLRLHLLLSGAAACALLAINPTFVTVWVGEPFFAGVALNALLAAGVVVYSLVHGLITTASVLGNRLQVGAVVLVNGFVQAPLAIVLGRHWGLPGIALAGLIAAGITAIPAGIALLRSATSIGGGDLVRVLVVPWGRRAAILLAAAAAIGEWHQVSGPALTVLLGGLVGGGYLWAMRPQYAGLPIDPRSSAWLAWARLLPAPAPRAEPEIA
jgi:hypothetical protein